MWSGQRASSGLGSVGRARIWSCRRLQCCNGLMKGEPMNFVKGRPHLGTLEMSTEGEHSDGIKLDGIYLEVMVSAREGARGRLRR